MIQVPCGPAPSHVGRFCPKQQPFYYSTWTTLWAPQHPQEQCAPASSCPVPRPQEPHPGSETCFPGDGLLERCPGSIRWGQITDSGSCSGRSALGRGGLSELEGSWGPKRGRFLARYFSKHLAGCSFLSLHWSSLTLRTFAESSEFLPFLQLSRNFIFGRVHPPPPPQFLWASVSPPMN